MSVRDNQIFVGIVVEVRERDSERELKKTLLKITLKKGPAILWGACQAVVGAVLVMINLPPLIQSGAQAESDGYTGVVVLMVIGLFVALGWQIARNASGAYESDEVQMKIAKKLDEAQSDSEGTDRDQQRF